MGRLADLAAAGHPAQGGPHEHGPTAWSCGCRSWTGQVLAAAQTLPRRYRCTGRRGKIALRAAAARRLPPQLADAPKRGFPVPLADWLRQEKYYALVKAKLTGPVAERFFDTGALCALLDAHRAGKTNAMTKLWAFYCFIEWYEVYFTGKIPPDL